MCVCNYIQDDMEQYMYLSVEKVIGNFYTGDFVPCLDQNKMADFIFSWNCLLPILIRNNSSPINHLVWYCICMYMYMCVYVCTCMYVHMSLILASPLLGFNIVSNEDVSIFQLEGLRSQVGHN